MRQLILSFGRLRDIYLRRHVGSTSQTAQYSQHENLERCELVGRTKGSTRLRPRNCPKAVSHLLTAAFVALRSYTLASFLPEIAGQTFRFRCRSSSFGGICDQDRTELSSISLICHMLFICHSTTIEFSNTWKAPKASNVLQVRPRPRANVSRFASRPYSHSPDFRESYTQKGSRSRIDSKAS